MSLGVAVSCLVLFAPHSALRAPHFVKAQEKKLVLRYFGQSFFQIVRPNGQKIVFDPHAIPAFRSENAAPIVDANIVLISHEHNDHNQIAVLKDPKGARVFHGLTVSKDGRKNDWNRYDEKILDARFRTLGTFHDPLGGMQRGKNTVWVVEADGVVFCHLGDLGHELTAEQVKAIGPVDVLMIPVGGIYTLNGEQAKKVVAQIKPRRFILPMHYGVPGFDDTLGPDEFLDGQKKVKKMLATNELEIPRDEPLPDAPTVVLLGWVKAPALPPKK